MVNAKDSNANMPAGLRMALTQNLDSLNRFSALSRKDQESFIMGARQISSKPEMQAYVNRLIH